jgi:hypothetical protein
VLVGGFACGQSGIAGDVDQRNKDLLEDKLRSRYHPRNPVGLVQRYYVILEADSSADCHIVAKKTGAPPIFCTPTTGTLNHALE